jgi:hypothetical protein
MIHSTRKKTYGVSRLFAVIAAQLAASSDLHWQGQNVVHIVGLKNILSGASLRRWEIARNASSFENSLAQGSIATHH